MSNEAFAETNPGIDDMAIKVLNFGSLVTYNIGRIATNYDVAMHFA